MVIYRVRPGDTLRTIAQGFRVTIQSIVDVNGTEIMEGLVTGMNLVIPTQIGGSEGRVSILQKPVIETLGYYNPSLETDKTALINELGQYLSYLGLFDFPVSASGEITGTIDEEVLNAARATRTTVLPVLTNLSGGEFSSELAHNLLSNDTIRQNLLNNTLSLLQQHNLIGVIIDFENMLPEDRNLFTSFIRTLSTLLHNNNKILVLNLPQKWEDAPEKPWVGTFDYNALGPLVDIAAIMTYEWGYRTGPPTPTAPLPYVRRSLDYALANNIPADKILMGMTLYGYDWSLPDTPESLATTVTLPRVWDLARRYGAEIGFDDESQQPYLEYTDETGAEHVIWFEDARSHYFKYLLAQQYRLRGVFYWIINQPFTATWYILSQLFTIRKR